MNILIACEESQAICKAFRKRGHNAYSCDILECSGGHPEWHFNQDVLRVIPERGGLLENGTIYYLPEGEKWDLMIAHPPCTYLSVSGARWLYHPDDAGLPIEQRREHPHHIGRRRKKAEAINFFMEFTKTNIKHWAIENPVGCMNTEFRKPDQIVQPYWFGDEASKKTCLWTHIYLCYNQQRWLVKEKELFCQAGALCQNGILILSIRKFLQRKEED